MKKNILITGANGFIGSFLTEESIKRGHNTVVLLRHSSRITNLPKENIRVYRSDFEEKSALDSILKQIAEENGVPDAVIHNAGITKTIDNSEFFRANVENTENLINGLKQFDKHPPRFILMSSLAAQGAGDPVTLKPLQATDTSLPDTLYGISKLEAEKKVKDQKTLPWMIIRPTGVYGPRDHDYLMVMKTLKSGFAPVIGFSAQHLSFIYVKDLARLVLDAAESELSNKTYIAAEERSYTTDEYTDLLKRLLNPGAIKLPIPLFLVEAAASISEGMQKFTRKATALNMDKFRNMKALNWKCDTGPVRKELNFKEDYPLEKGLIETIDWYRSNGWL
ncbi:MAG: NAD(P)-dependent oxidoreductase [Bacteroidales bacterium]|nr:NAD(P)-dependent oxidoreductase [Bacteroidales bacterium]